MARDSRLVRTRQRLPDYVRKAGPMNKTDRLQERQLDREFRDEIQEWADDLNGEHSIFGD